MSGAGVLQAAVVIERTYRAPVEELWALWTTKEGFESWWGPEGFRVEVEVIEARLGGALVYDMIAETAEAIATGCAVSQRAHSRFVEFTPHERLKLVDVVEGTQALAHENAIEVGFLGRGDATMMVVTLHPHLDPAHDKIATWAFNSQLARLDRRFTRN